MPTFSPKMARKVAGAFLTPSFAAVASVVCCSLIVSRPKKIDKNPTGKPKAVRQARLKLDFDVDAGRQIELHQLVDRLGGRAVQLDEALMNAHLELLARLLVDVRRPQDGVLLDVRRQENGARKRRLRCAAPSRRSCRRWRRGRGGRKREGGCGFSAADCWSQP